VEAANNISREVEQVAKFVTAYKLYTRMRIKEVVEE